MDQASGMAYEGGILLEASAPCRRDADGSTPVGPSFGQRYPTLAGVVASAASVSPAAALTNPFGEPSFYLDLEGGARKKGSL
jgi:hypothetical protein